MNSSEVLLVATHLQSWYVKDKNIINIDLFQITQNSIVGLVGRNGSGKTTLINTISGVSNFYSTDTIQWMNEVISFESEEFKRNRFTVFTENNGFMNWNFEQYIKLICKMYNRRVDTEQLEYLVTGFHFSSYKKVQIRNLSTGNKKKVFLIAGLYLKCPLLILDEPLDGLDFDSTEFLYQAIIQYKQYGSVLMSSHIIESITRVCNELLVLKNGKIEKIVLNKDTLSEGLIKNVMEIF